MFVRRLVERGAELVRRVRDELALCSGGRLEGGQHGVEARREAAQLVLSAHVDPLGQVTGLRDVLRGFGQPADRRQRSAGDDKAEAPGQADPGQRDQDQEGAQAVERVVDLRQRAGDLDRVALAERERVREGDHAKVGVLHPRVAEECVLLLARNFQDAVADRERHIRAARTMSRAVRLDKLWVPLGTAKAGPWTE